MGLFDDIVKPIKKYTKGTFDIVRKPGDIAISYGKGIFGGGEYPEYEPEPGPNPRPSPRPPGAPSLDNSNYYNTMAENMAFQNKISQAQLEMAKRQQGIAEEMYARGKEFRPIEKEVTEAARRGLDPAFYAAKDRNAIIQAQAGTPQKLMAAAKSRGLSTSSPAAIAALQESARGTGEQAATATTAATDRIRDYNTAAKAQAMGLGANIPVQAAGAYGAAAGVAGAAGQVAHNAASALANQYATEQSFALQQYQIQANASLAQQQLALQQQQLQEQIRQRQAEIAWQEQLAKSQRDSQMWGMLPVVGPIIGGTVGKGTHICTELLRQGKVDQRLYNLALEFDTTLSFDTLDGYQWWALGVANKMKNSPVLTYIAGIFARAYMSYAASVRLGASKPLLGRLVYYVGAPICNLIGRVRRWMGYQKSTLGYCV